MIEFGLMPSRWDINRYQLSFLLYLGYREDPKILDEVRKLLPATCTLETFMDIKETFIDCKGSLTVWRNRSEDIWRIVPIGARRKFLLTALREGQEYLGQLLRGMEMTGLPAPECGSLEDLLEEFVLQTVQKIGALEASGQKTRRELTDLLEEED